MSDLSAMGFVHSIQTLGALDGPGVRYTVFLQGCPLRCSCCHNPDTWEEACGKHYAAARLVEEALRYREYFGKRGGVTLSGGEPLLQPTFCEDFFRRAKAAGLNTCLDTSGFAFNDEIKALLAVCDRVLLDIKYPTDALYREHVGCGIDAPLSFLTYLNEKKIPTTLRSVIIPSLNDTKEHEDFLAKLIRENPCVDGVECLPFKKLCSVKYEKLGIPFPLAHTPEPSSASVLAMQEALTSLLC